MTAHDYEVGNMSETKEYIGFADFEFTCGSAMYRLRSEMLSVGIVICDRNYNIAESFYATSKPNRFPKLSKQCRELTHLSQEEISASPDSNEVLDTAVGLMNKYGVNELWVWGNFDKPGLQSDIRQHRNFKKECSSICSICNAVHDIQAEMVSRMNLPQAINIKELASAFGYVPDSGSFHNALNDATALYTIHKAVFTTDFRSCPEFAALVEDRIEKMRQVKAAQEKKRREKAFSVPLSSEEQSFFDDLDDNAKGRFIYLRYRIVLAIEKYSSAEEFAYVVFENPRKIKIFPKDKLCPQRCAMASDIKYFKKSRLGQFIINMI